MNRIKRDEIKSSGYIVDSLEAALWCVLTTDTYKECVLKAVNLGSDTDTIAAIAGGLAGALYGYGAIPEQWRNVLIKREYIEELLNSLYNRKGYHYVSDLNKDNLKVIASDITKRKKIVLPDELWQYDIDENNITLARMVTLSLLYPVFFKPLTLNKSKIVDGGLFDSFPIGAITDNNLKKIGFQLISKKSKKISTLDYLVDIDTKFIKTLDFRITHNEIARLFDQGYFAAKRIIPIIEKHNKIM